jgi:hypothetical protein
MMIKAILKAIYTVLPLPPRARLIAMNLYQAMRAKRIYTSPDQFPLNYLEDTDAPIFGESEKEGFFYRYYQEKAKMLGYGPMEDSFVDPEELFGNRYEIVYGSMIDGNTATIELSEDAVIPLSVEDARDELEVTVDEQGSTKLRNLPPRRFHYFSGDQGSRYTFGAEGNFVLGKAIPTKQKTEHKKKLVLVLFVDGLASPLTIDESLDDSLMQHTSDFFQGGLKFRNHFSNGEWTLPSVPSFFTGMRQQKHGFFGPQANHVIGTSGPILSEVFKANDYLTFHANSNWRVSPAYGYVKGFDRTVYKKEMGVSEVTQTFLEHMRAFPDRDHFAWLTLVDAHHILRTIPDVSSQVANSTGAHRVTPWYDPDNTKKSVFVSRDEDLTEIYVNEIKRLDYYLQVIYDFVERTYSDDEILVALVSDHGQAFLTSDQHPLSLARTKVPWMLRGGGIPKGDAWEFTENVDLYNSLIDCCELTPEEHVVDSQIPCVLGGTTEREFAFSESIYPGQTFKAVFRDSVCECRFESGEKVLPNGIIIGEMALENVTKFAEIDEVELQSCIDRYESIAKSKAREWNSNLQAGFSTEAIRQHDMQRMY